MTALMWALIIANVGAISLAGLRARAKRIAQEQFWREYDARSVQ